MDQTKQAEIDIAETAEYLEHVTHLALACLLQVSHIPLNRFPGFFPDLANAVGLPLSERRNGNVCCL